MKAMRVLVLVRDVLISHAMFSSWEDLGKRIVQARKEEGLTQSDLAARLELDRTVISKIETGLRSVSTLEIARIAEVLRRSISWFLNDPPPSVVSRRSGRDGLVCREDLKLEEVAQDMEQLIELGVLTPAPRQPRAIHSIADAELVARETRKELGLGDADPAWELVKLAERLGMYTFVLELSGERSNADGSYVSLPRGGVALIGASAESGRRRFTIVHELGHHILADEYAAEWIVDGSTTDAEKVVNAFAIHFLLPRAAVMRRWEALHGAEEARDAAIHIAIEFGVSWSAVCAQLERFELLSSSQFAELMKAKPTTFDFLERGLRVRDDANAPLVPPGYAMAVTRAMRKDLISSARALEMLHGTLHERDLPPERPRSLDEMAAEIDLLP
jgi:Zn-dependent peptidase ImmA (M78 family)/DNA-binding XRE family transcriptional regulator